MPQITDIARAAECMKRCKSFGSGLYSQEKAQIVIEILHCSLINFQESGDAFCRTRGFDGLKVAYDSLLRERMIEEMGGKLYPTERLIEKIIEEDANANNNL